jgi:hypothetical protein
MIVTLVIATRKSEPGYPEVLAAWDEYAISDNPEGFAADVTKQVSALGNELETYRLFNVRINELVVLANMNTSPVDLGDVVVEPDEAIGELNEVLVQIANRRSDRGFMDSVRKSMAEHKDVLDRLAEE